MSFQGDISSIALGDVFQNLSTNGKTGTLAIRSGTVSRQVRFRAGKVVSYGDDGGFSVLQWLADKEIIPAAGKEEASRRFARVKKKTLAEILEDLRLLDREEFRGYASDLVKEMLYETLSLREGAFEFKEEDGADAAPAGGDRELAALGLELNSMSLVMEAARRSDDWQKIRRHIPSEADVYLVPPAAREGILAEAGDEAVSQAVDLLDGTRTLRQVIARMPYSRFEACRTLAALIAEKKARPLDADHLDRSPASSDPQQAIACLKAVLDREPNNRDVLGRLADLHEKEGSRDDAATCAKLLAISHLEEGDLAQAEEALRKSLHLNPRDIVSWRKLWDVVRQSGDRARIEAFGNQFTEHFRKLGLMEIVRDHLAQMVELFPQALRPRVELAESRFALGDKKGAVTALFEVANELLKRGRMEEADKVYVRILKFDRENAKARELHEKIASGKLARRRSRRRRLIHQGLLLSLLLSLVGYLSYELYVRGELVVAARTVFADSLLEHGRRDEAARRIEAVGRTYPFSLTARFKVPDLLRALRHPAGQGRGEKTAGPAGGGALKPLPKAEASAGAAPEAAPAAGKAGSRPGHPPPPGV